MKDVSIIKLPAASKYTVVSLQNIVGVTISNTVTVELQTEELPAESVTVIVIMFVPTLAQVNVSNERVIVLISQLSVLPLSV